MVGNWEFNLFIFFLFCGKKYTNLQAVGQTIFAKWKASYVLLLRMSWRDQNTNLIAHVWIFALKHLLKQYEMVKHVNINAYLYWQKIISLKKAKMKG